jgi:L-serine deaminase
MSYYNQEELIELENKVTALTEHLRLKELECQQLADAKAGLRYVLEMMTAFYGASLKDEGIDPESSINYTEAKRLLEQTK